MQRYYNKEEREIIEQINYILKMQHRSKPYDMNSIEDLKEQFTKMVAQFLDYQKFWYTINNIFDQFDESLEYFDPITWTRLFSNVENYDKKAVKTYRSIKQAECDLSELLGRAEESCKAFLLLIGKLDKEKRKSIFGKAYSYSEDELNKIFEETIEILDTYSIEESRDSFIEIMDKHLMVED